MKVIPVLRSEVCERFNLPRGGVSIRLNPPP
jgi:hypothetical protein